MKKIICLAAAGILASASLAAANGTVFTTYENPKFSASANVKVCASSNDTTFAAASKHLNGTRMFGVSSGATQVMYSESKTPGQDIAAGDVSTADSSAFSSWSSL